MTTVIQKKENLFFFNRLDKKSWRLGAGSFLEMVIYFENAPEAQELQIDLVGRAARLQIIGLIKTSGQTKTKLKIRVLHQAPQTQSQILIKAVAEGSSEAVIEVLAHLQRGAKGAITNEMINALLLSPTARAKPLPTLEIEENAVIAKHAATVGQLGAAQLFYLMSRGLSEEQAKKLLVDGFIQDIFEKIESPDLKKRLCLSLRKN